MMLSLLCIALSLAVATAQEIGCCGPNKWEGRMEATTGYAGQGNPPGLVNDHRSIHYDYDGKRLASFVEMYDENTGKRSTIRILENFSTMRRMEVEEGACTITELTHEMRDSCLPPDAEHTNSYYAGVSGASLELQSYEIPMERQSDSFHMRVTEDCVTFTMRRVEVSESPETEISYSWYSTFHGFKEGIADESVFETPEECQHVNPKIQLKNSGKDVLSAFFHKF